MKVGIIAPIKFLEKYCITDVQYYLPWLVVTSPAYKNFYLSKRRNPRNFMVLDCRKPGWRREPEDFDVIETSLKLVEPDIIIAPSYMFNLKASGEVLESFLTKFHSFKVKIVRCLEGSSKKDTGIPFGKWAVPSHMYKYLEEVTLSPQTIFIENHLCLGELDNREGILVTSLPVRLGLQGRLMSDYRPSPESLTFKEDKDLYPKVVKKNIEDTIEYYKGDSV